MAHRAAGGAAWPGRRGAEPVRSQAACHAAALLQVHAALPPERAGGQRPPADRALGERPGPGEFRPHASLLPRTGEREPGTLFLEHEAGPRPRIEHIGERIRLRRRPGGAGLRPPAGDPHPQGRESPAAWERSARRGGPESRHLAQAGPLAALCRAERLLQGAGRLRLGPGVGRKRAGCRAGHQGASAQADGARQHQGAAVAAP